MSAKRVLWALAILILLAGCGDSSLLLRIDPAEGISIRSVSDGTIISSGENIPITIEYDEEIVNPISLEVRLLDSSGWEINLVTIAIEGPEDLPEAFGLPEIADGKYSLDITLYDAEGLIYQEIVSFFRSDAQFRLKAITTFPAIVLPGGGGLAVADISVPSGTDPYVRWKFAGEVFREGYMSDGADWVEFIAPDEAGVYPMVFELFPVGPAPGTEFAFDSSYFLETQTFVSAEQQESKSDLTPEDSYYALFHFRGETKDYSQQGVVRTVTSFGDPSLMVDGSVFGYRIEPESGFVIDDFILPPDTDARSIGPFSLSLRGKFESMGQSGSIVSVTSPNTTTPAFVLGVDEQGNLTTQFGDMMSPVSSDGYFDNSGSTLTLSVVPQGEGCWFAWYVDGFEKARVFAQGTIPAFSETGETTLFVSKGMTGILDEFGIYYQDELGRPSPDANVYANAMTGVHGGRLIFADGFDGNELSERFLVDGDAEVIGGKLEIGDGSKVTLPIGLELSGRYSVVFELIGEGTVGLEDHDTGNAVFTLATDGTVIWDDGQAALPTPVSELTITRDDEVLLLATVPGEGEVAVPIRGDGTVDLHLAALPEGPSSFEVDWILILKSPSLADANADGFNSASISPNGPSVLLAQLPLFVGE